MSSYVQVREQGSAVLIRLFFVSLEPFSLYWTAFADDLFMCISLQQWSIISTAVFSSTFRKQPGLIAWGSILASGASKVETFKVGYTPAGLPLTAGATSGLRTGSATRNGVAKPSKCLKRLRLARALMCRWRATNVQQAGPEAGGEKSENRGTATGLHQSSRPRRQWKGCKWHATQCKAC